MEYSRGGRVNVFGIPGGITQLKYRFPGGSMQKDEKFHEGQGKFKI